MFLFDNRGPPKEQGQFIHMPKVLAKRAVLSGNFFLGRVRCPLIQSRVKVARLSLITTQNLLGFENEVK